MLHTCSEAARLGVDLADLALRCHHKYGAGAFFVSFASLAAIRSCTPETFKDHLLYSLKQGMPQFSAARSFDDIKPELRNVIWANGMEAPDGNFCDTVLYRSVKSLEKEGAAAIEMRHYDPVAHVFFVGQYPIDDPNMPSTAGDVHSNYIALNADALRAGPLSALHGMSEKRAATLKLSANTAMKKGQIAEAKALYLDALSMLSPKADGERCELWEQVQGNLALCSLKDHAWSDCSTRCLKLLDAGANSAKIHFRLGSALAELGQEARAVEHLEKAVELEPKDDKIRSILQRVRDAISSGRVGVEDTNIQILTLMACYVSSHARMQALQACLDSIAAQSYRTCLLISWSCASDELATAVTTLFAMHEERGTLALASRTVEQLSQFEHYRRLVRSLQERERLRNAILSRQTSTWVAFTDDDDIWHPHRLRVYADTLNQGVEASCASVCCPWYAIGKTVAKSADAVGDLLAKGAAEMEAVSKDELRAEGTSAIAGMEYWTFMPRLSVLIDFFNDVPAPLLNSPFCDLAFRGSLIYRPGEESNTCSLAYEDMTREYARLHGQGTTLWMYYYNVPGGTDATVSSDDAAARLESYFVPTDKHNTSRLMFKVLDSEHSLAENSLQHVQQLFPRSDIAQSAKSLANMFSMIRRNLEVDAANLWCLRSLPAQELADRLMKTLSQQMEVATRGASKADIKAHVAFNFLLLERAKPLRTIVTNFGMDANGLANKFEGCVQRALAFAMQQHLGTTKH